MYGVHSPFFKKKKQEAIEFSSVFNELLDHEMTQEVEGEEAGTGRESFRGKYRKYGRLQYIVVSEN